MAQINFFLVPDDVREIEGELRAKYDAVFLAVGDRASETGILETTLFQRTEASSWGDAWRAEALLTRASDVPKIRQWPNADGGNGIRYARLDPRGIEWTVGTMTGSSLHLGRVYHIGFPCEKTDAWVARIFSYLRRRLPARPELKYRTRMGRHAWDWYRAKNLELVYLID